MARYTRKIELSNGKNAIVRHCANGQWLASNRGRKPAVVTRTMGGDWVCRNNLAVRTGKTMTAAVASFYAPKRCK